MPEHVQVASVHGVPTVRRAEQADCTDQEAWMELFPLSETSSKCEVIPKELSNDVDGMLRPRYPLGKIKVLRGKKETLAMADSLSLRCGRSCSCCDL